MKQKQKKTSTYTNVTYNFDWRPRGPVCSLILAPCFSANFALDPIDSWLSAISSTLSNHSFHIGVHAPHENCEPDGPLFSLKNFLILAVWKA